MRGDEHDEYDEDEYADEIVDVAVVRLYPGMPYKVELALEQWFSGKAGRYSLELLNDWFAWTPRTNIL